MRLFCFSLIVLVLLSYTSVAQNCEVKTYKDFTQKAKLLIEQGQYIDAMEYFYSAKDYCSDSSKVIERHIKKLIELIDYERLQKTNALNKANKLISAFYFYEDKIGLTYGQQGKYTDVKYYYIDKNGNNISKLGTWDYAEQFRTNGFAFVKEIEGYQEQKYLIDTLGKKYKLATSIEELSVDIKALDIPYSLVDKKEMNRSKSLNESKFSLITMSISELGISFLSGKNGFEKIFELVSPSPVVTIFSFLLQL